MKTPRPLQFATVKRVMLDAASDPGKHSHWVEEILPRLFNVDQRGDTGMTLLMLAARLGLVPIVKSLLAAGASPHLTDQPPQMEGFNSTSVLGYAYAQQSDYPNSGPFRFPATPESKVEIVKLLLEAGASLAGPGCKEMWTFACQQGEAATHLVLNEIKSQGVCPEKFFFGLESRCPYRQILQFGVMDRDAEDAMSPGACHILFQKLTDLGVTCETFSDSRQTIEAWIADYSFSDSAISRAEQVWSSWHLQDRLKKGLPEPEISPRLRSNRI